MEDRPNSGPPPGTPVERAEELREEVERLNPVLALRQKLRENLKESADLEKIPEPESLIKGVLCTDSLAWIYGKPGSAKSFVSLSWAASVGTGSPWLGRPVKQGPVLYLIAEGGGGFRKRVRAWESANGRYMEGVKFLDIPVQLLKPMEVEALTGVINDIQPVLIVIDTQARCTLGANENDNGEMSKVVAAADRLRAVCGSCVLLVHHSGRDGENLRGASAFDGAATTVIKTTKDAHYVELHSEKEKDDAEFETIFLQLTPEGSSAVITSREEGTTGAVERVIISTLYRCFLHTTVTAKEIMEACEGKIPRRQFYEAITTMVSQGRIIASGSDSRRRYALPEGQEMLGE